MKKKIICYILILFIFSNLPLSYNFVYAENDFQDTINNQIDSLDLGELENILETLNTKELSLLSEDLKSYLKDLINGETTFNYANTWNLIVSILTNQTKKILPLFAMIIAVGILISLISEFNLSNRKDISSIINFAFVGIVIILCIAEVSIFVKTSKNTLMNINKQINAIFPVLFTIMTAIGSTKTISFYQPLIAFLSNIILNFMINILLPIVLLLIVFSICSHISKNVKLDKLSKFFMNFFKWSMGVIFTIFITAVTISGLSVSGFDTIGIKTAKFTIKSFIPYIGGFLSDSFNIVLAGSVLIKNALGVTGIIILFSSIIVPIISMLCFKFGLELCSGVLEPICDSRLCNYLSELSKLITMLISVIVVCAIMYLIMIASIMSTANLWG